MRILHLALPAIAQLALLADPDPQPARAPRDDLVRTNQPGLVVPQTFSRPSTTFQVPLSPEIPVKGGTFSRPESTFSTPLGSFSRPETTFSSPLGSFSRPSTTFSNPTQALPLEAAQGTFSRPKTTVSLPHITFSNAVTATPLSPPPHSAVPNVLAEPASELPPAPPLTLDLPPGATLRKSVPPRVSTKP